MSQITLDGNNYEVVPGAVNGVDVLETTIDPFADFVPAEGPSRPEHIPGRLALRFPNFMLGFGRDRIDSDSAFTATEYRHFWDSLLDTRRARDIRLPILEEDSTETGLEVIRGSTHYKSNFWSIWEDDTSTDIVARKYDADAGVDDNWTAGGAVLADSSAQVGQDMIVSGANIVAAFLSGTSHLVYISSDGASWSVAGTPITASLLTATVGVHADIDGMLLENVGAETVAVVWHEDVGVITFFSSTDGADTWVDETTQFSSGGGPKGVAAYSDIDGVTKLYVGSEEGLWLVNTSVGTWTANLIYPMPSHVDNCRRMTVHNGALIFAQGVDDDSPAPIIRMTVQGDARVFENDYGLDWGDGVPEDMLGPVRWMESAGQQLYISVGGGKAARKARILCHNGKGWHSMRQHGTADEKIEWIAISAEDDATPRLHYAIRTGTAVSNTKFLGQPLTNPNSGVTIKRELTGYLDMPYLDAGLLESGIWLQYQVNAEGLSASASGEYIVVTDGIDSAGTVAARTTNARGNILSGTTTLTIASGAGVASVNLGARLVMHRDGGTNTDTGKLKDVAIIVRKKPADRRRFETWVSIEATMAKEGIEDAEVVLANLRNTKAKSTLPIFSYGASGDFYVEVQPPFEHRVELHEEAAIGAIEATAQVRRGGRVHLVLEEPVST